jgi:hypothetical protein
MAIYTIMTHEQLVRQILAVALAQYEQGLQALNDFPELQVTNPGLVELVAKFSDMYNIAKALPPDASVDTIAELLGGMPITQCDNCGNTIEKHVELLTPSNKETVKLCFACVDELYWEVQEYKPVKDPSGERSV